MHFIILYSPLNSIFKVVALPPLEVVKIILLSSSILIVGDAVKFALAPRGESKRNAEFKI
jgi:hypothetical protein